MGIYEGENCEMILYGSRKIEQHCKTMRVLLDEQSESEDADWRGIHDRLTDIAIEVGLMIKTPLVADTKIGSLEAELPSKLPSDMQQLEGGKGA